MFSGLKKALKRALPAPRVCVPMEMAMGSDENECECAAPLESDNSFFCDDDMPAMREEPKEKPKAIGLDGIIMEQKASGCFGAAALEMLGLAASAKDAVPKNAPAGLNAETAQDVWVTVLVLEGLKKRFADKASEWTLIARKSEKWVQGKLGDLYAVWAAAAEAMF